jgi:hypothetical protein
MFDWIRKLYRNLFTDDKFPNKDERESVGDKKIGDVYDITYMPSPDNPGEMVVVFSKDSDEPKTDEDTDK